MIRRRGEGRADLETTPETEDETDETDDAAMLARLAGEGDEDLEPPPSFLGAVGQLVAAVLVVAVLLSLFIAGAVAFRWVLR